MAENKKNQGAAAGQPPALFPEFTVPSLEEWNQEVVRLLKGAPFDKKMLTPTYEGITLAPLYTPKDVEGVEHLAGLPGEAPFVRGTWPMGRRVSGWEIAQEMPYPSYTEFNAAVRSDLERGQTAINLLLDAATQAGLDADHANGATVGKGGTSISSIIGLSEALAGVDLSKTPIYVQPGSAALPFAALLVAWMRKNGQNVAALRGALGLDPYCGLVTLGALPLSLSRAFDELALLTRWAKVHAPQVKTVAVYGNTWSEAGGHAVQELAFSLATAVDYLRELEKRGVAVDDAAPRILFGFSIGTQFFLEIAKLRAARLLWAKAVEACGGSAPAQKMTIHARTLAWDKTAFDPYVNLLRGTTEAFAAVAGGCDSLHVAPFDEPLGLPNEFSRRVARNTQLVLREESHLDHVVDAAGGAWYVEKLTDELAQRAWALFQQIEAKGGMGAAIAEGFPQQQVAEVAAQRRKNITGRKDIFVGTNQYPNADEKLPEFRLPDYAAFHAQRAQRLSTLRVSPSHADNVKVLEKLQKIFDSQPGDVFEAVIEAAGAGATIGEFTSALRHHDGDRPQAVPVKIHRGAEIFEQLRCAVLAWRKKQPAGPQVFLANLGPVGDYMPRLDFTRSFFQVGGFEVAHDQWFENADAAVAGALASGAKIVTIVGLDDSYPEAVPKLAQALKKAPGELIVIVAGFPKDHIEPFKAAGVDEFIHVRSDVHAVLSALAQKIEVF